MKSIFAENGRILGKSTKGAKFLLILTALFGHQPTCKNFRGNADWNYTNKLVISMKTCTGLRNLLRKKTESDNTWPGADSGAIDP